MPFGSLMETHALELLKLTIWMLGIMGGAGITLAIAGGKALLNRMTKQDTKLVEIHTLLYDETKELRERYHSIDRRVAHIEGKLFPNAMIAQERLNSGD